MEAVGKKSEPEIIFGKINLKIIEEMNCLQVREKLESLINGDLRLEETHSAVKRTLFRHLENCQACCRSFDAGIHFRPSGRSRIY